MHLLSPYAVWPSPLRVRRMPDASSFERFTAHWYGVAGSPVVPTTTIGGAPSAWITPGSCAGWIGQNAHVRPLYAIAAPNRGATFSSCGTMASYAAMSVGAV